MKVLIADDQPEVRSAMKLILEQQSDTQVIGEVADASALLKWLSDNQPDLLLLDWELPGKTAQELVPGLRFLYPKMRIIVLNSQPQTKQLAIAEGADDFIGKNEPPERLIEIFEKYRSPGKRPDIDIKSGVKEYNFRDFTEVKVSGAFKFEVSKSDSDSVNVTADDVSHIVVEKEGNTLKIGRRGFDWMLPFHRQPEVSITMLELHRLVLSGASSGKISGFQSSHDLIIEVIGASRLEALGIAAGNLQIKAHGASTFKGNLNAAGETTLDVMGAGKVEMEGSSKIMVLKAYGASRVELERFRVENAYVKLMGASRSTININGKLDASLAGASNLSWIGNPIMGDIETIGASSLRRK